MLYCQGLLGIVYYCFAIIISVSGQMVQAGFDSEQEEIAKSTHFLIVPGPNILEVAHVFRERIINSVDDHIHLVETPILHPDFGQSNSQKLFANVLQPLQQDENVKNVVIYATSVGTATVLNYVAKNHFKVSAIILEAVMASGNSAIHHEVELSINSSTAYLPGSYYWLPYVAKLLEFFSYNPAGEQAIFACENLPNHIPVIIIHATENLRSTINDTYAIYHKLSHNLNLNIYLMKINERKDFDLWNLKSYPVQSKAINMILRNLRLPYHEDMIDEQRVHLSGFQPNPDDYKKNYLDLMKREAKFKYINFFLTKAVPLILFAYMCTYFLG